MRLRHRFQVVEAFRCFQQKMGRIEILYFLEQPEFRGMFPGAEQVVVRDKLDHFAGPTVPGAYLGAFHGTGSEWIY